MEIPQAVPVMILPNASLFPQAMLPLYIFEPRYRRMLADSLETHRLFSVAMRKPGSLRESPAEVAGLGFIRASVGNKDGTSHLVLQGLARVELGPTLQYKPYRVQHIHLVPPSNADGVAIDALMARVRELVQERLQLAGPLSLGLPVLGAAGAKPKEGADQARRRFARMLQEIQSPELLADMATHELLPHPLQRQIVLETLDVETRLKHVIHFLMAENQRIRKPAKP
jgi:ATP-dependent Lon protease